MANEEIPQFPNNMAIFAQSLFRVTKNRINEIMRHGKQTPGSECKKKRGYFDFEKDKDNVLREWRKKNPILFKQLEPCTDMLQILLNFLKLLADEDNGDQNGTNDNPSPIKRLSSLFENLLERFNALEQANQSGAESKAEEVEDKLKDFQISDDELEDSVICLAEQADKLVNQLKSNCNLYQNLKVHPIEMRKVLQDASINADEFPAGELLKPDIEALEARIKEVEEYSGVCTAALSISALGGAASVLLVMELVGSGGLTGGVFAGVLLLYLILSYTYVRLFEYTEPLRGEIKSYEGEMASDNNVQEALFNSAYNISSLFFCDSLTRHGTFSGPSDGKPRSESEDDQKANDSQAVSSKEDGTLHTTILV